MIELNVKFQEKYKRLDALCADIYCNKYFNQSGVTAYITEMENTRPQLCSHVYNWEATYKQLKHLRWVRNQLAHEAGTFEYEMCTEADIEWLSNFHAAILQRTDPLAVIGKIEREGATQVRRVKMQNNAVRKTNVENTAEIPDKPAEKKQKLSLWGKIKAKFKKWFSE